MKIIIKQSATAVTMIFLSSLLTGCGDSITNVDSRKMSERSHVMRNADPSSISESQHKMRNTDPNVISKPEHTMQNN